MALALGKEPGSVVNHALIQTADQPEPKVGMGATLLGWTDRYAATMTDLTGDILTVQTDRATRTDANGMSENQAYSYEPDPDGTLHHFQRRDDEWVPVQWNDRTRCWVDHDAGYPLRIGVRDHYYDFSY